MTTFLPVGFILAAAVVVYALRNLKRGVGYAWFTAFLTSLLAWGGILALHWVNLPPVEITPWRPFNQTLADQIIFHLDGISWPYAMVLVGLNLAVIFTSPVRFQSGSSPFTWAINLAFTAFGLLGLLATSPIALVIAWMVIDLMELIYLLSSHVEARFNSEIIVSFSARLTGTFLVLVALVLSRSNGAPLTFETAGPLEGLLILVAVAFRMGLLPVNLAVFRQLPVQRSTASTALIILQLTGLIPLARLTGTPALQTWGPLFTTLTVLASFYGAILWLASRDELVGRPYWSLAMGGLAVLTALSGQDLLSLVWGLLFTTVGGVLWLYTVRGRGFAILPIFALLSLSALPFTPAALAWPSATDQPGNRILMLLIVFILSLGYIRHAWRPEPKPAEIENWGLLTYSIGLFSLAGSAWLITILGMPDGLSVGWWPGGVIIIGLTAGGAVLLNRGFGFSGQAESQQTWYSTMLRQVGNGLASFLRLGWLYKLFDGIFRVIQFFLLTLESVFEGDGGVLWSLLILALLLTVLGSGILTQ